MEPQQQQIMNEVQVQLHPLVNAMTAITNQLEEIQAENQELLKENQELRTQVRDRLSTIPVEVKNVLNAFIKEFKEVLESKKPSDMSESIKKLAKAMDNLSVKLEDSIVLQADLTDKTLEAAEQISRVPRTPKLVKQNGFGTPQT